MLAEFPRVCLLPLLPSFLKALLLLLLLLSRFSRVRLRATPQTAARQAPPSLGFSRQEHCSGLPFLIQLFLTLWTVVHQVLLSIGKITGGGSHALLQGIFPTQGLNPSFLRLLHCRQILYCRATGELQNVCSVTFCRKLE